MKKMAVLMLMSMVFYSQEGKASLIADGFTFMSSTVIFAGTKSATQYVAAQMPESVQSLYNKYPQHLALGGGAALAVAGVAGGIPTLAAFGIMTSLDTGTHMAIKHLNIKLPVLAAKGYQFDMLTTTTAFSPSVVMLFFPEADLPYKVVIVGASAIMASLLPQTGLYDHLRNSVGSFYNYLFPRVKTSKSIKPYGKK